MKLGFIVECGRDGAETEVIPYLARMLSPKAETDVVPLDRKPKLKRECGRYARQLLEGGCDRVLIIWDLLPDWGEYEGRGCQRVDREQIAESLRQAGLRPSDRRIRLVCIHNMLEAWLLADERALSSFLSTDAHPVRIRQTKAPEKVKDAKARLKDLFKKQGRRVHDYLDRAHAIEIVKRLTDLRRLESCPTFARFARLVAGSASD